MRGITAFGAVAALWLASATAGIAAPSLTVLCGVDEAWCAAMKKAYEAKAGIEISMTRRSTGDILNLIRAEKAAPSVDVWWGGTGDTHLQAGSENLLEPYQPLFAGVAAIALIFAGRRIWRPVAACEPGQVCQRPTVNRAYKLMFVTAVMLLVTAMAFPLIAYWFY